MKKAFSIITLLLFVATASTSIWAQIPPKDSVKAAKSECPMKKGGKKCLKSGDQKSCNKKYNNSGKSGCCKEATRAECKNK